MTAIHQVLTDEQIKNRCDATLQEFHRYLELSEDMVASSSKDALVKTARILAMQAAHYAKKYGEEPMIDLGNLLSAAGIGEDGAAFLRDGAKTFVGVLGVVAGGLAQERSGSVQ